MRHGRHRPVIEPEETPDEVKANECLAPVVWEPSLRNWPGTWVRAQGFSETYWRLK